MQEPSIPSAILAVGTTTAVAAPCKVTAIMLHPGSAASTVTLYDNASTGTGTILGILQGTASGPTQIIPFDSAITALKGVTAVVSGTGAQAQVYFQG